MKLSKAQMFLNRSREIFMPEQIKPDQVIVTVPCLSGAPWDLDQLKPLQKRSLMTMRLPDEVHSIEGYADFVSEQVPDDKDYVLVGDSFGAIISIALAIRQPNGLKALILSGGFAKYPLASPILKAGLMVARFLPGPLYRAVTLRYHALSLASPYDENTQTPWSKKATRDLFLKNTPFGSYILRTKAALSADYTKKLDRIKVPTLLITPSYDKLIGEEAAKILMEGIPDATEVVLHSTGHMVRFSHPLAYAEAINDFLKEKIDNMELTELKRDIIDALVERMSQTGVIGAPLKNGHIYMRHRDQPVDKITSAIQSLIEEKTVFLNKDKSEIILSLKAIKNIFNRQIIYADGMGTS